MYNQEKANKIIDDALIIVDSMATLLRDNYDALGAKVIGFREMLESDLIDLIKCLAGQNH